MYLLLVLYVSCLVSLIFGALFLHLLPRLGTTGKHCSEWFCVAPGVDFAVAYFTLIFPCVGLYYAAWQGLLIGFLAQYSAMILWIIGHELTHREQWQKKRIHPTLSGIFGGLRNHLAVWITSLVVPIFWAVRLAEILIYPAFPILVRFPKYQSKDWVNVSRQKFSGLVGYDLIWCLYCDWMTGVWSLGTEMLRNVESFWCPIRFYDGKKCENCKQDFPDLENGWIAADQDIEQVANLLASKYQKMNEAGWFGHPNRQD